jgi:benzoyl-CoA reductase subunit C
LPVCRAPGSTRAGNCLLNSYFCDYVPEEILFAAGMVPIRITAGRGNVTEAAKHLQSNVCSFARGCLDQAMNGVYDYLDGLVTPHTCDVINKINDLWAYRLKDPPFVHYFWTPHKLFDDKAAPVMLGEVERLIKCTEDFTGKAISDDNLLAAIEVYDRNRSLLKRIYELRRSSPPLITGVEALSIALTSTLAPKDLHNEWTEAFLSERENSGATLSERPRVMISASILDDLAVIAAVEETGALVVADDMCTGSRYFWNLVGSAENGPKEAIASRYRTKLPCPRTVGALKKRSDHLLNLARDYRVDGVLFYILRCCDAHMFEYPVLAERLKKAGYKVLFIQGDQTAGANETLANRVGAFTEILSS